MVVALTPPRPRHVPTCLSQCWHMMCLAEAVLEHDAGCVLRTPAGLCLVRDGMCPAVSEPREGIFTVRLTAGGRFRLAMRHCTLAASVLVATPNNEEVLRAVAAAIPHASPWEAAGLPHHGVLACLCPRAGWLALDTRQRPPDRRGPLAVQVAGATRWPVND